MHRSTARATLTATAVAVAAVLVLCRPDPALLHQLTRPRAWVAGVGTDRATLTLATAAIWLLACWVALGLGLCALTATPRVAGSVADRIGRHAVPACLRRLVLTATGLGIVLTPVAAGAATVAPARPVVATPAPAWPTDDPLPTPVWPTQAPSATPPTPPPASAPTTPPAARPNPQPSPATTVVVQPGDTLWTIAAEHLPQHASTTANPTASAQRVARSWPAWFAANRAVIGDDPNLITPGEHLRAPAPSRIGQP